MFDLRQKLTADLAKAGMLYPWAGAASARHKIDELTKEVEEKNERLRELDESLTKLHAKKEKYDNRKEEVDQKMSNLKSEEIVQGLQRKTEYKDSMDAAERMMIRSKRAVDGADTNVKDM